MLQVHCTFDALNLPALSTGHSVLEISSHHINWTLLSFARTEGTNAWL